MNQQRIISLLLLSGFILTTSAIAQDSKQEQKSDTPATNDIRERMRERRDEIRGDDKSKNNTNAPAVQANQPTADNRADEKTTEDGPPPSRRVNARDILDRMRSNRRESQPILPVRPGVTREQRVNAAPGAVPGNAVAPVNRKLRPDGSRLVDRAGRLTHSGDYLTFTFESRSEGTEELPLRLLPNRLLEDMELISESGRKPIVFVVSGQVTEYRGVNYLLVEKLLQRAELGNFR